ncbi:tRNA (adenosine(37)-N6)-threonylcarbamoyltransferase complex ATPase subunit type 1 TsaE [Magnetococcus sp. PR-3]|uniref:tRNA (adenosine(37)-N6)-threonylcarbamoyltransferase complex ATPase subunit type 1 TsaE n=1 Tax=Magnetococcus sp. PR-3 TaxID=3120355 RepID=UPI002FCE546B
MNTPSHWETSLESLARTEQVGNRIGSLLPTDAICLFTGDLAAGKTTLIKAICGGMGVDPRTVISPTYTMTNIYQGEQAIYHVDLYRIEEAEAFSMMDVDDWINPEGVTLIEWPQIAAEILADLPTLALTLERQGSPDQPVHHLKVESQDAVYAPLIKDLSTLKEARP